jgi:hypothetical protein
MKQAILFSLLTMGMLPANSQLASFTNNITVADHVSFADDNSEGLSLSSQPSPENEKMLAVIFRAQDFCRAELKDFEFDVQFNVVSATVYFSGTNFKNVETGFIKSNSLKPIRSLMARCAPGTMIVFDNVKVLGPDKYSCSKKYSHENPLFY